MTLQIAKELTLKLHQLENDSEEADEIRDQMDPLWYNLTDEERRELQKYSADLYAQELAEQRKERARDLMSEMAGPDPLIGGVLAVGEGGIRPFSPYGRDPRGNVLTEDDAKLLSGTPEPLRILVPVKIEK